MIVAAQKTAPEATPRAPSPEVPAAETPAADARTHHESAQQTSAPGAPAGHRELRGLARAMARLADWRIWTACTVIWAAFAGVFFTSSAPFAIPTVEAACGQPPPDMRLYSSAADVMGFLTACGPAGRDAYRDLQFADLAYPTVFALFLTTSLALVISALAPPRHGLRFLIALPAIGALCDYAENTCAWLALAAYPEPAATSTVLGLASAAKNLASWTAGIAAVVLAVILVITKYRAREDR